MIVVLKYYAEDVKKNLGYLITFILAFFLGFYSNRVFHLNYDVFFHFSQLIFYFSLFLLLLNLFLLKFKYNHYIQLFGILIISASSFGMLLINIQENFIFTRWLELGHFSSNDALDYVEQSKEFLYKNDFYTGKGRAIFPILYSGFLGFFKFDSKLIQLTITLLCAFVTFLSSFVIYKKYGYIFAILFSCLCVDFLHEHVGGVCTENIGYILGGISFICFQSFLDSNNKRLYYFILTFFLLLLGFVVRPSIVFIVPSILLFCFIFLLKISKLSAFKCLISTLIIFFSVTQLNKFVLQTKSPDSPKGFNNAYDSWYATGQLGKYVLNKNYINLPGQLWSKIYQDFPELYELKGEESSSKKKLILKSSILENPQHYLIGSLIQIIKFYEVQHLFEERYHNSAGFLHIEFDLLRIVILFLFTFGGIFSLVMFIKNKDVKYLFFTIIYLSTILTQPFIYGGEARSAATVIFYLNFMIIYSVFCILEFLKKIVITNYSLMEFRFISNSYYQVSHLSLLPFLLLILFFFLGIQNKFDYLKKDHGQESFSCSNEMVVKSLQFHTNNGIFISSKDNKNIYFEKILDTYVDISSILKTNPNLNVRFNMNKEDFKKRDKYKFLNHLIIFTNTRAMSVTPKEMKMLGTLGKTYSTGGGFFINPVNTKQKKLEGLVILNEDMFKKGFNHIYVCL